MVSNRRHYLRMRRKAAIAEKDLVSNSYINLCRVISENKYQDQSQTLMKKTLRARINFLSLLIRALRMRYCEIDRGSPRVLIQFGRFTEYSEPYFKGKESNRSFIIRRDGKCLKCGSIDDLTIDHIIPKAMRGNSGIKNLQTLCRKCNMEKGRDIVDYRPEGTPTKYFK